MVVELLLIVILFIISPPIALLILATIAMLTVLYYAALLIIALASFVIACLPAIAVAAATLAAAYIAVVALMFLAENLVAVAGNVARFFTDIVTNTFNAIGSFFYTPKDEPTTAYVVEPTNQFKTPLPTATPINDGYSQDNHGQNRFFPTRDEDHTSSHPPASAPSFP